MKYYNKDVQEITESEFNELVASGKRFEGRSTGCYMYTDAAEVARDAEEAQWLVDKPMHDWKHKISKTDNGMPRYLEDHITDDHDGVAGNEFLQVKYDDKKTLRATKPE